MTPNIPAIITDKSITVSLKFKPVTFSASDPLFETVKQLLMEGASEEDLISEIDRAAKLEESSGGLLTVLDGVVYHKGRVVHDVLSAKFLAIKEAGADTLPWERFVANVYANPDERAISDLYGFLEKSELPITDDGCFFAYKKVRNDYLDVHSATFDNSVGKVVTMPREKCDSDPHRDCSSGLHFCSYSYLQGFSGKRIMVIKINPRDVVSIPVNYALNKGRCCRYEVVSELDSSPDFDHFENPVEEVPRPEPEEINWAVSEIYTGFASYLPFSEEQPRFFKLSLIRDLIEGSRSYPEIEEETGLTAGQIETIRLDLLSGEKAFDDLLEDDGQLYEPGKERASKDETRPGDAYFQPKTLDDFTHVALLNFVTGQGGQRAAARSLGVPRTTLQERVYRAQKELGRLS